MFKFSDKSLGRLAGLHKDLIAVVVRAIQITEVDFTVIEGMRTIEKQRMNIRDGVSTTLKSRHLTGHAVDLYPWVDGKTSHLPEHYLMLKDAMFKAADEQNIQIEWGGDWKSFIDKPHFQLPWSVK